MKRIVVYLVSLFLWVQASAQTFFWANSVDTHGVVGRKIICDESGNIISTGSLINSSADFDFGPGVVNLTSGSGKANAYIVKYNTQGVLLWAKLIFSQTANNHIRDLGIDSNNNVYLVGTFKGTIDFDPGPGVFNMTQLNLYDLEEIFIEKLDSNGNFVWAKQISDTTSVAKNPSFRVTEQGDIFITGNFYGTIDFDPNIGVHLMSTNLDNAYLLKLNTNGEFIWAKQIEGATNIGVRTTSDIENNLYLIGQFHDTIDADPNAGIYHLAGTSYTNIFIIKLNSNGNFIWGKSISAVNMNSSIAITSIQAGKSGSAIYYGGYFSDSVNFDSGITSDIHVSNGDVDVYFSKLDSAGNYNWTKSFGGTFVDKLNQIASDSSGDLYLVGNYSDNVDFNPDTNYSYFLSNGQSFISKFDTNGNFMNVKSFGNNNFGYIANNSISIDADNHIFCTGEFQGTQDFDPGANVYNLISPGNGNLMFIEKFGFCGIYYDTSITHCNTINLWGANYDSSKQFVKMFSNINECDSNFSVNLKIIYGPTDTLFQTDCKSFTINNITYTTPGLHIQSYPVGGTCDSLFVINLTLISPGGVNVTQTSDTLRAFPSGYTYQWLNCTDNLPIPGAVDSVFIPNGTGSYKAVIYFSAGCTDTTTCKNVIISHGEDVNDYSLMNFSIHPNPSKGHFEIVNDKYKQSLSVNITDIFGKKIIQQSFKQNDIIHFDLSNSSDGLYFVEIDTEKQKLFFKVVKQQ